MRILYLTHRIPYPPDKGDKIRSYHLLVHLARLGSVDLVTHVDDPRDLRHRQILADLCRSIEIHPLHAMVGKLRALHALAFSREPLSVAYMTRRAVHRHVDRLLRLNTYDLIVGYSSQVAAYVPDWALARFILDLVDVDSEKFAAYAAAAYGTAKWLHSIESRRLRAFVAAIGRRAAALVLSTEREAALFAEKVGGGNPVVIGNGVRVPDQVAPARQRQPGLMIFVGAMDYEANVEAAEIGARDVLPLVRRAVPEARFRIVGRNPSPRVRALASLEGVEITGEVAAIGPHLEEAALALVPLRVARGIQNKVLEALAFGLPVVTTEAVLESLGDEAQGAVFTGSGSEDLAVRAVALFGNAKARDQAQEAGRRFVRAHHDWRAVDEQWDSLIHRVVGTQPSLAERS